VLLVPFVALLDALHVVGFGEERVGDVLVVLDLLVIDA
jgi:hypothetical protein